MRQRQKLSRRGYRDLLLNERPRHRIDRAKSRAEARHRLAVLLEQHSFLEAERVHVSGQYPISGRSSASSRLRAKLAFDDGVEDLGDQSRD